MIRFFFALVLTLMFHTSFAGITILKGVYQGVDLYVKNPYSADGVGFCVFEVLVNGEVTSDEVNSSAFAVDLSLFDLNIGDPIEIVIRSKADCTPYVINPESIEPRSTFSIESIHLDDELNLHWTTAHEAGALPFVIEQFKWNKWVKIGEVMGEGDDGPNDYVFKVRLTDGENTFHVKQQDVEGIRSSDEVVFTSDKSPVKILHTKIFDTLEFDQETQYEVFNEYGMLVCQGYAKTVDMKGKAKGTYYINYGSKFGEVLTKK